ncbi:hypothetical protein BHYA_0097g00180 [Botrytis hyacinthi]|uniref:Uncharacterized protein n=1 Tax=Botrytis hyacinthi TaxID=278943 RepID=A0A4Z1GRQ3_9HELO|nr:hypothetical protein BHYA_0097g00180 [Botrytis hyacinthi]
MPAAQKMNNAFLHHLHVFPTNQMIASVVLCQILLNVGVAILSDFKNVMPVNGRHLATYLIALVVHWYCGENRSLMFPNTGALTPDRSLTELLANALEATLQAVEI